MAKCIVTQRYIHSHRHTPIMSNYKNVLILNESWCLLNLHNVGTSQLRVAFIDYSRHLWKVQIRLFPSDLVIKTLSGSSVEGTRNIIWKQGFHEGTGWLWWPPRWEVGGAGLLSTVRKVGPVESGKREVTTWDLTSKVLIRFYSLICERLGWNEVRGEKVQKPEPGKNRGEAVCTVLRGSGCGLIVSGTSPFPDQMYDQASYLLTLSISFLICKIVIVKTPMR